MPVISRTLVGGDLSPLQRSNQCILQPQSTELDGDRDMTHPMMRLWFWSTSMCVVNLLLQLLPCPRGEAHRKLL